MASTNHLTDDGGPATRSGGGLQQGSEAYRLPGQQPKSLPECGILSKTVVESPVANYILPARIRSNLYKDLAFVGVSVFLVVFAPSVPPSMSRERLSGELRRIAPYHALTAADADLCGENKIPEHEFSTTSKTTQF